MYRMNKLLVIGILITGAFSLHLLSFIALFNNRNLLPDSSLYCNLPSSQESLATQSLNNDLSVELDSNDFLTQKLDPSKQDAELNKLLDEPEDKSPSGKFQSEFHKGKGKNHELIKQLYSTRDLVPSPPQNDNNGFENFFRNKGFSFKKAPNSGSKQPQAKNPKSYPLIFDKLIPGGRVRQSYIKRKREYKDIIVKEVLPTIHNIDKPFEEIILQSKKTLSKHNERNQIIEDFRIWEQGRDPSSYIKSDIEYEHKNPDHPNPLKFSSEQRKDFLDKTLTLPKETQLNQFIKKYFYYHPDKGDLAITIRDLYFNNLQRLAYAFSYDPNFFLIDYLQENLNKEDFLKNVLYQVSRLHGTKSMTEILFTVENIYEIQDRAIRLLFNFIRTQHSIPEERKNRLHYETLARFAKKYQPILSNKQIYNEQQSSEKYTKKRLEIINYLLKNTPNKYRARDALFEKGRIQWEYAMENKKLEYFKKALKTWKSINKTPSKGEFLHRDTWLALKPFYNKSKEINTKSNAFLMQNGLRINRILKGRLHTSILEKRKREEHLLWP